MDFGKIGSLKEAKVEILGEHGMTIMALREPNAYEKKLLKAIDELFDDPNVNNLEFRELPSSVYYITVYSDDSLGISGLQKLEKISGRKVRISRGLYGWLISFDEKTFTDIVEEATE